MVGKRHIVGGIVVAIIMTATPTAVHAQQTTEDVIALLEQILQLTQLVLQLQTQLEALEAREALAATTNSPFIPTTNNTPPTNTNGQQNTPIIIPMTPTPSTTPTTVVQTPDPNEVLVLPVYVHLVNSELETVQAQSSTLEIQNILTLVNSRYWAQANIRWEVRGVLVHKITNNSDEIYVQAVEDEDEVLALQQLFRFTEGATALPHFSVFVVHDLGGIQYNGHYYNSGITVVSETNGRQEGRDYIAYLFAHELGHALGLSHTGTDYNLMHPGGKENEVPRSERTLLLSDQIDIARHQARLGTPWNGAQH